MENSLTLLQVKLLTLSTQLPKKRSSPFKKETKKILTEQLRPQETLSITVLGEKWMPMKEVDSLIN